MVEPSAFIRHMPKAELHMHLEGSIEPESMIEMARRNGVSLPYASADELRAAYDFTDLQSFLDVLYIGNSVLQTRLDFFEMTLRYLERAHADTVLRAEVFLSPQAHLSRGVAFDTMMGGVLDGLEQARSTLGISADVILGFQRQKSEAEAFEVLELALPYRTHVLGIGLGSAEAGNPPRKFERVFAKGRAAGWRCVAHAGEEGPAEYIEEAIDLLKVERIDHGVRCDEKPSLVERLAAMQMPLTVCPLSNVKLRVFDTMQDHNLKVLLDQGLMVTVNSDDPTQFGGYVNDNFELCRTHLGLGSADLVRLARNSFQSAFVSDADKLGYCDALAAYCEAQPAVASA
ncbi:adenosine deaminase [soil metagenome]